jgi:DNA repair photolyase
MIVKEVLCKSIISKSRLGTDYSINPYRGCVHACEYCYAPYVLRENRKWGEFMEVKMNAPEVLEKDLRKYKKGTIFISSVTDAYNPLEKDYKITRKILEKLVNKNFFISIQTKSNLVLRDLDILKQLKCEVGMTITTFDENAIKVFEPLASSSEERLKALKELKENKIKTYIFFGPILPFISDKNLEETIKKFSSINPDYIYVDSLNIKNKFHWVKMRRILEKHYPELVNKWEEILFTKSDYYENLKEKVVKLCRKYGLNYELCY